MDFDPTIKAALYSAFLAGMYAQSLDQTFGCCGPEEQFEDWLAAAYPDPQGIA